MLFNRIFSEGKLRILSVILFNALILYPLSRTESVELLRFGSILDCSLAALVPIAPSGDNEVTCIPFGNLAPVLGSVYHISPRAFLFIQIC